MLLPRVSSEGAIALAPEHRDELGIQPGDQLIASVVDGAIVLRPASGTVGEVNEYLMLAQADPRLSSTWFCRLWRALTLWAPAPQALKPSQEAAFRRLAEDLGTDDGDETAEVLATVILRYLGNAHPSPPLPKTPASRRVRVKSLDPKKRKNDFGSNVGPQRPKGRPRAVAKLALESVDPITERLRRLANKSGDKGFDVPGLSRPRGRRFIMGVQVEPAPQSPYDRMSHSMLMAKPWLRPSSEPSQAGLDRAAVSAVKEDERDDASLPAPKTASRGLKGSSLAPPSGLVPEPGRPSANETKSLTLDREVKPEPGRAASQQRLAPTAELERVKPLLRLLQGLTLDDGVLGYVSRALHALILGEVSTYKLNLALAVFHESKLKKAFLLGSFSSHDLGRELHQFGQIAQSIFTLSPTLHARCATFLETPQFGMAERELRALRTLDDDRQQWQGMAYRAALLLSTARVNNA